MLDKPVQARNYLVACFVISLTKGETIQGRSIRYATMRNYVKAISKLYTDRGAESPYCADVDYITLVLKAVKKYERMKHRRDMIHDEMAHLIEAARPSWSNDSLQAAIADWVYLGRFAGFRSIEWCQKSSTRITKVDAPIDHLWTFSSTYAFIPQDFDFFAEDKRRLPFSADLDISRVAYVAVRFRKQKNDMNNEIVPFYRDTANPAFCPVGAALRICARALRLGVTGDTPLGVYTSVAKRTTGARLFITNSDVEKFLRGFACKAFGLKHTDPILSRWSAHSIRVTACNLLHRQGFSDSYIQTRLRWRGNTWMDYLRNTLYSAQQHTRALSIPNNNLPRLCHPQTGTELPRHRGLETLDSVIQVASAA
jgi:hypothetical protein